VGGPQAATVGSWREISTSEVMRLMRVEQNGLKNLSIEGWSSGGRQRDPDMPLEF
jgi:hypothetical protein